MHVLLRKRGNRCVRFQASCKVPCQQSAAGSELEAARVTTGPFIQHRWTPMTRLNAVLRLLPEDAPQPCYVCTVRLLPQHRNNAQQSNINRWWFCDSVTARTVKTNTTENSNKRADGQHVHAWSLSLTHTHTSNHSPTHARTRTH